MHYSSSTFFSPLFEDMDSHEIQQLPCMWSCSMSLNYFIQSGLDELSPRCLEMLVCTQIQRLPQPSRCVHSNAPVPHEHITEHMTLHTGQVWNEALAKWLRTQLNPQGKTRQKGEANREAELCLDSPPGTAVYRRGSACSQTWWALQGIAGFTTQIQFPEFCQTACPDT